MGLQSAQPDQCPGSHAPASTVPSRRATAGAVTTGRQKTVGSPAVGTCPLRRDRHTVKPQVSCPDHDRSRRCPRIRGHPGPNCGISEGRQDCTRDSCDRRGFDTQRLPEVPFLQTSANPRSRHHPDRHCLSPWRWGVRRQSRMLSRRPVPSWARSFPSWRVGGTADSVARKPSASAISPEAAALYQNPVRHGVPGPVLSAIRTAPGGAALESATHLGSVRPAPWFWSATAPADGMDASGSSPSSRIRRAHPSGPPRRTDLWGLHQSQFLLPPDEVPGTMVKLVWSRFS